MKKLDEALKTALKNKRSDVIAKWLFDVDLTEGQKEIVNSIVYPEHKRVCISAMTRYGKTFGCAVGTGIYIYLNENKKVYLLAPRREQAKLLRNEIAELIVSSPQLQYLVDERTSGTDRLKKEVSKKRITFKNGCSLQTLSAQGKAERAMGHGGDLNIMDESCLIDEEVYRKRIFRMLGESPDSKLVELSNPWHKDNQFFDHWTASNFKTIRIDYKQAIKEGRATEDFIEEARQTLTPQEFTVLYESDFPEDTEDTLIKWDWIEKAITRDLDLKGNIYYGVDVARKGNDKTVVTKVIEEDNQYKLVDLWEWQHKDTMHTVGRITNIVGNKQDKINVDEIGVGGGVVDRLEEMRYNVNGVKINKTPENNKNRFRDRKAESYFELRGLFEEGRIDIIDKGDLVSELNKIKYEFTSSRKIKINDPNKSPDFADSLMLSITKDKEQFIGFV